MNAMPSPAEQRDQITIRGRSLSLSTLVDPRIHDAAWVRTLRAEFVAAAPYPHLRLAGLFDPVLLALVEEEFDLFGDQPWRVFTGKQERTLRSAPEAQLGPASELYFSVVNSRQFVAFLAAVTGIEGLIVDHGLFGGGLHESRNGGKFGIHRDFDRHPSTGLANELVMLTYLNRDWDAAWGGELELWDAEASHCVARVSPDLGVTLLMRTGPCDFHGHPRPLQMPEGRARRSLGAYYYSNPHRADAVRLATTTTFASGGTPTGHAIRSLAKRWTPPAIWDVARRLRRYAHRNARND